MNPLSAHMHTMTQIQTAVKQARDVTGLFIGTCVTNGKYQVGILADLPNGESTWTPLCEFQSLADTLTTLRSLT